MRLLVTGGAGYIGSHVVLALLTTGHDVVVVDDFSTGRPEALERVQAMAGRSCAVVAGDVADGEIVSRALVGVDAVIHLAALCDVAESMEQPERYFHRNIGGMAALLHAMQLAGVSRILYSSSAAVYGSGDDAPHDEDAPLAPESPYASTKAEGERMCGWMARRRGWSSVSLRYFNAAGAHASGRIGQPIRSAAALIPRALRARLETGARLTVFGTDYPTPDGTCLRDYVHVEDLARAHVMALGALDAPGHAIFNVGTGRPSSVREVLAACERATGAPVPVVEGPRRPGDVAVAVADPRRLERQMGFTARLGLDDMVASAWRWARLEASMSPLRDQRGTIRAGAPLR